MTDEQTAQTPLEKLIEAVEAGVVTEYTRDTGMNIDELILVQRSLEGSLDAALALHDALLPGWMWTIDDDGAQVKDTTDDVFSASASTPARAWLLAILRAFRSVTA